MTDHYDSSQVASTAQYLRENLPGEARVAVIAGSGLGGFVRAVESKATLNYSDIPHIGDSTVAGHRGELVYGITAGIPVYVFNGRRHLYEGISPRDSTRLLRALLLAKPVEVVVISNAAGGLNPIFQVGDLMLIADQVNFTFCNPLLGPNRDDWGPRFPDLSNLYCRKLRSVARQAASEAGIVLREGVYLGALGPSYETRAEVRAMRMLFAADVVGMSTVTEAIVCAHMGRQVLGISYVSNLIIEPGVTTHDEVIENSALVEPKFVRLLGNLLPRLVSKHS